MRRRHAVCSAYLRGAGRIADLRGARSRYGAARLLAAVPSEAETLRRDWAGVWEDLGSAWQAVAGRLGARGQAAG